MGTARTGATDSPEIFAERQVDETAAVVRATDLTGVHVLKHENLFVLSNAGGDMRPDGRALGMFDGDTRVLSTYDMLLNGTPPVVLRAGAAAGYRASIQLTNPDLVSTTAEALDGSEIVLRRQSLGVVRERVISSGLREQITITNYTTQPERARLTLRLDADFADIFELRGVVRPRRGKRLPSVVEGGRVVFGYRGVDGAERRTIVELEPALIVRDAGDPRQRRPVVLELDATLEAGERRTISVVAWTVTGDAAAESVAPRIDADQPAAVHRAWRQSSATIETSHLLAERALERASADLRLLINSGPEDDERYIAAGVPWFSCLFGRDSLITSLQLLAVRPQVAQATLRVLARRQATDVDEFRDAQPGKILHELRTGEMARTGEIPHTPYFGSVDATPLWLILLDQYERWTADEALVDLLWPNALAALGWIDEYGDVDGDGFVEYERRSPRGLLNQGWKDSADAIRFRDGTLAQGPVALVEVQAYVYAARRGIARLARRRRDYALAERQEVAAERLRARFEDEFWMGDIGTYALALDGAKKRVDAVASNAGHAVWAGIASRDRAASVAAVLTGEGMWSGWGIRTLSDQTVGYNPIGYHLGSVWPHDNGICAAGFARYGLFNAARKVAGALLEATVHFREARLPELFCGFDRSFSPMPVPYPVACSPQAWAAGAPFHIVAATLGMEPNAHEGRLELLQPALPEWLPDLRLRNLRVGEALVDLAFAAEGDSISVEVLRRTGDLDVVVRL